MANTLDPSTWLQQQSQQPSGPQSPEDWLNSQGESKPQPQEALAYGATTKLPGSQALSPGQDTTGQGEDYFGAIGPDGKPTGKVGGMGVSAMQSEWDNYIKKKQSEFYAPVYTKQADGTYKIENPSVGQYAARLVANMLGTAGDVFSLGGKAIAGAFTMSRGLEDLADMAQSPLPDIFKQDTAVNFFMQPALNVYNALRIATGTRKLTPDDFLQKYDASIQAASVAYTSVKDPMVRQEYMRRYLAGENPQYLSAQLANPWAEMIGQVVFDPLNIVGGIEKHVADAAKLASYERDFKTVAEGLDVLKSVHPELADGVFAGLNAMDDATRAKVIPQIAEHVSSVASKTVEELKNFGSKTPEFFQYTASARREFATEKVNTIFQSLQSVTQADPDTAAATLRAMALIGSGDSAKAAEAMTIIRTLPFDVSNVALSKGGIESGALLHEIMTDSKGVFAPEAFLEDLKKAKQAGDNTALLDGFTKKLDDAAAKLYPTVSEKLKSINAEVESLTAKVAKATRASTKEKYAAMLADKQKELSDIPDYVKRINAWNEAAQKVMRPVNKFFSGAYIIANPGSGVRNLLGNITNTFADMGPGAVLDTFQNIPAAAVQVAGKEIRLPSDILTEKMLGGFLPKGALEEIGAMAEGSGTKAVKAGDNPVSRAWNLLSQGHQATERVSSSAIVAKYVESNMRPLLRPGVLLPTTEELGTIGLNAAAQERYYQIAKSVTFGDHEATMALLRPELEAGVVESWRNIHSWMNPNDIKRFKDANILPAIEDAANNSKTIEEAMAKADAIVEKHMKAAAGMFNAAPPVPTGMDLAGEGFRGDNTEFLIKKVANENARLAAYDAAHGLINDGTPIGKPFLQELFNWQRDAGGQANKAAEEVITAANEAQKYFYSDPAKAIDIIKKTNAGKDLQLEGLVGRELGDAIWGWAKPEKDRIWTQFNTDTHNMALNIAERYAAASGKDFEAIKNSDTFLRAEKEYQNAMRIRAATYIPGQGLVSNANDLKISKMLASGAEDDATRALFSSYGIRQQHGDQELVNTINKYTGKNYPPTAIQDNTPGIFEDAKAALEEKFKDVKTAAMQNTERRAAGAMDRRVPDVRSLSPEEQAKRTAAMEKLTQESRAHRLQNKNWTDTEIAFMKTEITGATPEEKAAAQARWKAMGSSARPELSYEEQQAARARNTAMHAADAGDRRQRSIQESADSFRALQESLAKDKVPMPVDPQNLPIDNLHAYAAQETLPGVTEAVGRFKNQLHGIWGKGDQVRRLEPAAEAASASLASRYQSRLFEARTVIAHGANEARDFALYNYSKRTYADLALGYIMPYSFWYTRTYGTWLQRLARNPEIVAGYAKYRRAMETAHANLPDWWKYNINSNELLGAHSDHPLMFNIEASLNPLNGVTGVDFTDPKKVVGEPGSAMRFWTQSLDDISKFGPAPHTLLTMATAVGLQMAGENDAASRWAPRLFPQTAALKGISSEFGQPVELDPATNIFGGGKTPYEENQIGRAMAAMVQDGKLPDGTPLTEAQAQEAMHARSGPVYEAAYRTAIQDRAPYQMLSFIGGTGFKARTPQDLQVDQFYNDYNNFWANSGNLSPQEFNTQMQKLHETYPFMDSLLLSKKDGIDRDRGYAYSVMTRIRPGQTDDVGKAVGLDPRLLDRFYSDKGDTSKWSKSDRDIFFAKIVDIGAILDVPPNSVKQEWTAARNEYQTMQDQATKEFGKDINTLVQGWYDAPKEDKAQYLLAHPEVQAYNDWKAQYVIGNTLLSTYYNGMGQLRDYYDGKMRAEATKTLGPDIFTTLSTYNTLKQTATSKEYNAFYRAHPEIKKYYAILDKWDVFANRKLVEFANYLPEGQKMTIRQDVTPNSTGQQDLSASLQKQGPSWNDVAPKIATDLHDALLNYFRSGKPLTYAARIRLEGIAKQLNMSLDDFLVFAGESMQ